MRAHYAGASPSEVTLAWHGEYVRNEAARRHEPIDDKERTPVRGVRATGSTRNGSLGRNSSMLRSSIPGSACLAVVVLSGLAMAQPAIVNGSFEADEKAEEWPHYYSISEITGWVHDGAGWGLNDADGPFHGAGNGATPDGEKILFMQGAGTQTISQTITGFNAGYNYVLSMYVNAREGVSSSIEMDVKLGDAVLKEKTLFTMADPYHYVEIPFVYNAATMGSGVLTISSYYTLDTSEDVTFLLDNVQLTEGEAAQPVVFRFDCDNEGFAETNNVSLDHTLGWMIAQPTDGDPHTMVNASIAGSTLTEFGAVIDVQNAPDANPIECAMYWFADGGHGRALFNVGEGANVVRLNVPATQDAGDASWDDSVSAFRLDMPETDATPLINAGTTFRVDVIALSADPEFMPDPWTLDTDCDNDGLSNDYEALLGTDPENADSDGDGVSDGIELQYGSDPLDPQNTVAVPLVNYLGLGLTALLLAAAAMVLLRRRAANH